MLRQQKQKAVRVYSPAQYPPSHQKSKQRAAFISYKPICKLQLELDSQAQLQNGSSSHGQPELQMQHELFYDDLLPEKLAVYSLDAILNSADLDRESPDFMGLPKQQLSSSNLENTSNNWTFLRSFQSDQTSQISIPWHRISSVS